MSKYHSFYRSQDGRADYEFSFEEQWDGTWRAYILNKPNYGGRAEDAHSTHRLSDWGRKYICWDHPLQSLDEVMQVAALWSNKTQEYIRTGRKF